MNARLSESTWHGMPALALESEALRLVILPWLGAKIVSIYDRRTGHEWLVGPGARPVRPVVYGAAFVEQDMSGWDEMFPTIKPCVYPALGPYFGRSLPDHGEVWALPWQREVAPAGALAFSVEGRAIPYRFSRVVSFRDPQQAALNYRVLNTGASSLAGLWSSHPQFTVTPALELIFPPNVREIYNVREGTRLGASGARLPWPQASDVAGQPLHLNHVGPATRHDCHKFYAAPEYRFGWAALHKHDTGHWLRMDWDPAQIPYVGIWVDEGAVNPEATIAIEISNGFYDSLATAWENQQVLILEPGQEAVWEVLLTLGDRSDGDPAAR